jgi:hypothetical protein
MKLKFFLNRFPKKTQISNLIKMLAMAAELFHVHGQKDEQTDGHGEGNSRFSKFREIA